MGGRNFYFGEVIKYIKSGTLQNNYGEEKRDGMQILRLRGKGQVRTD